GAVRLQVRGFTASLGPFRPPGEHLEATIADCDGHLLLAVGGLHLRGGSGGLQVHGTSAVRARPVPLPCHPNERARDPDGILVGDPAAYFSVESVCLGCDDVSHSVRLGRRAAVALLLASGLAIALWAWRRRAGGAVHLERLLGAAPAREEPSDEAS